MFYKILSEKELNLLSEEQLQQYLDWLEKKRESQLRRIVDAKEILDSIISEKNHNIKIKIESDKQDKISKLKKLLLDV